MQKELELYEILYVVEPTFTEQETEEKMEYYQKFLTERKPSNGSESWKKKFKLSN